MMGLCRWKCMRTMISFCAGWKKASLMFLKMRSSFSPLEEVKRSPLACSSSVPAAFFPPSEGFTLTSRSRWILPPRMRLSASCCTMSASSATCFSCACTRLRSSLMRRKVLLRLVAALALSVISRMKWEEWSASGGICCAAKPEAPGATKLMRRKVQTPSSDLETFLMTEMWKGTSRPKMGSSTQSDLPSTCVWLVLSEAPEEETIGKLLQSL
mmetsp:Transcript_29403/g.63251  ORF Transcript_29403/g.63251 Transcript_29403/m.63251 type:complete len:213 (+) Transcript_29403:1003-1641(+)